MYKTINLHAFVDAFEAAERECCDWIEYNDLAAIQADYPHIASLDDLQDYTTVIVTDADTILIQQF